MKQFTPYFKEHFYQKLLTPNGANPVRNRADGFLKMFELLDAQQKDFYAILETGTMRADHGEMCFGDDGCSTFIFDAFVTRMGGQFLSIDISQANCEYAKKNVNQSHSTIICSDSVTHLWQINQAVKADLIYLDSFDVDRGNPHPSALHHLKELCAVIKNCKERTIIAVDDADAFFDGGKTGKAMYVRNFLENINAKLIHDGYQLIYQL